MAIKLPAHLKRYIQQKLDSGEYPTEDAVPRRAVAVMRYVERTLPSVQEDLRRELQLGLDDVERSRVAAWDLHEMRDRIRAS